MAGHPPEANTFARPKVLDEKVIKEETLSMGFPLDNLPSTYDQEGVPSWISPQYQTAQQNISIVPKGLLNSALSILHSA